MAGTFPALISNDFSWLHCRAHGLHCRLIDTRTNISALSAIVNTMRLILPPVPNLAISWGHAICWKSTPRELANAKAGCRAAGNLEYRDRSLLLGRLRRR